MKNTISIQPLILCGGFGTRLWPLSRAGFPKQFLALGGKNTLFQEAILRIRSFTDPSNTNIQSQDPFSITNEEHRFLVFEQLSELGSQRQSKSHKSPPSQQDHPSILLEPYARNTAPALTIAALEAIHAGEDSILVVTPADQMVQDQDAFIRAIRSAIQSAKDGSIVILGITPNKPETGYGYIQCGKSRVENTQVENTQDSNSQGATNQDSNGPLIVKQFVEKPNLQTAEQYLQEGNYYWNGGIFVLRASTWLKALQTFRKDIYEATKLAYESRIVDGPFIKFDPDLFAKIPSESIDYAVIEKCPGSEFPIKMIPLDAGWSDLGAWDAVWNVSDKDPQNNVLMGDTVIADTTNTYIHSSGRLVSAVGVDNLVIVETADAVLVANKNHSQDVKKIIHQLEAQKREEKNLHRKVARPWGWYDSIDEGERFKVKRIQVKPGASLSLQMHHHRAEHWIVVKGIAEITNGEKVITLFENQSTYIPQGQKHRLKNPGIVHLEIIEVQSGSYLGEDDIVRFEDNYGRSSS